MGSGQLHAPAALPPGKSPWYPLDRRLGGPQSQSRRFGEVKILDPAGTRTPIPRSSSPQLAAIPTTLSRLFVALYSSNLKYCCAKLIVTILPEFFFISELLKKEFDVVKIRLA
jgi:hypothetical protein